MKRNLLYGQLVHSVKRLAKERDLWQEKVVKISLASPHYDGGQGQGQGHAVLSPEKSHKAFELSDHKAKIRKLTQLLYVYSI